MSACPTTRTRAAAAAPHHFEFPIQPEQDKDSVLWKRLAVETPALIVKTNRAYLRAVHVRVRGHLGQEPYHEPPDSLWADEPRVLPEYYHMRRRKLNSTRTTSAASHQLPGPCHPMPTSPTASSPRSSASTARSSPSGSSSGRRPLRERLPGVQAGAQEEEQAVAAGEMAASVSQN